MTEQKIKNKDCIFCKIIKGEIPCYKIYENEEILAYLDIFPVNIGHTLIIPKNHHQNIFEIPESTLLKITKQSKIIATNIKKKLNYDGVNILQSNGKSAGQVIHHYHMHIIPRYENDKMELHFNSNKNPITQEQGNKMLTKLLN